MQSLKEGVLLPDVRVYKISNAGELYLRFTKEMVFPDNFKDILNDHSVPRKSRDIESIKD